MDYENLTPQYRIEEYLEAIVEGWAEATQYPYPDYPSWRIEEFLDAFITYIWEDGDHPRKPCPEPVWRLEECLRAIYDVMTGAATPWPFPLPTTNRIEEYLAAIHAYLANGTELPVPEPVWRIEQWLAYALDAVKQGGDITKTVSGTMVHITDALAKAALSVLASIEPIQDLNGYANPWPAGGGKQALNPSMFEVSQSEHGGVTASVNVDGTITLHGTATTNSYFPVVPYTTLSDYGLEPNVSYTLSGHTSNSVYAMLGVYGSGTDYRASTDAGAVMTFTESQISSLRYRLVIYVANGTNTDGVVVKPMICKTASPEPTVFAPYANICPITGIDNLSVYVSPTDQQAQATTYNVSFGAAGTVYGGTVDVVTGVLTVDRASISSYAGETLPGAWISDRDVYAPGTSPTTGAQVVYELATPLTYQLTPQEVQMLLGENYVWSSSGDTVSVTYYAEGNANTLQSLNILLGGNYSNPKTADDVSDKEALEIILGGNK